MKEESSTLLALIFVAFSLLSLVMAKRSSDEFLPPVRYDEIIVSELGLQLALKRAMEREVLELSSIPRKKLWSAKTDRRRHAASVSAR